MGVFVVGMHRSGTSAVAACLEALGLDVGDPERLMEADAGNPAGYYEQQDIGDLNDELLAALGGGWDCPPTRADGWELDPTVATFHRRAAAIVGTTLTKNRWLVKDPRITLLLPLWRRAVLDRCVGVLVVRDPMEVAWSLALRNAMPILTGLALWSEYNCTALTGLSGLPVYVCNYDELVADPLAAMTRMHEALEAWNELPAGRDAIADIEAAAARVRPELRRNTWPRDNAGALEAPGEVERLVKFLGDLGGAHAVFEPGHPPQSPWEEALLNERRTGTLRYRMIAAQAEAAAEQNESLSLERNELATAKTSLGYQLHARNLEFDALSETAKVERGRLEESGHALHYARERIRAIEADLADVQGRRRAAEKAARDSTRRLEALQRSRLLRIARALSQLRRSLFGS